MRLHLNRLELEDIKLNLSEPATNLPALTDLICKTEVVFTSPLRIRLKAFLRNQLVEVEGTVETGIRQSCSRCLKEFDTDLHSDFALTYTNHVPDDADGKETELRADELGLIYFSGEEIDLQEGIREQIVLAIPIQPLCDESCKGLCPLCGGNRNETDCGCHSSQADNPFAALRELKGDLPSSR